MTRELVNPNTGDRPREITREEVARLAKTGCKLCNGAGCVAYAQKAERGQLKADAKLSLCRCIGDRLVRRVDVSEIDGKLCWLPPAAIEAERVAREKRLAELQAAAVEVPAGPCGFKWKNDRGELRCCALPRHPLDVDHADKSGARVAHPFGPKAAEVAA